MVDGDTEAPQATETPATTPDLEIKIAKQIDYYFGTQNLMRDKFLQAKIKEDPEGWVTIECLTTFNRLKALSSDQKVIADIVRKAGSTLVEVSEDGTKIRRLENMPVPERTTEFHTNVVERSAYVKGFPKETTMDELLEFFQNEMETESVQKRVFIDKTFRGSVFVVFKTKEQLEAFMLRESFIYKEHTLHREKRADYHTRKSQEMKVRKAEKKKKTEEESKARVKAVDGADVKTEEEAEEKKETYLKGCILQITGCQTDTRREDFTAVFGKLANIAWVDFQKGDTDGWIRFAQEDGASRALDKAREVSDGKIIINGIEVSAQVLEGDQEKEYWQKVWQTKDDVKQRNKEKHHKKKKWGFGDRKSGGRRGGHRGGKRNHGGERGDRSAKQQKTE